MNVEKTKARLMEMRNITFAGCWEFTGTVLPTGYGEISVDGKRIRVHRLMYVIEHGSIPEGLNILHSCDNPPCFNPAHLRAGTQKENIVESVLKDRHGTAKGKNYSSVGSVVPWICVNDHDMRDPSNVFTDPTGRRRCKTCRREAVYRSNARRKAKLTARETQGDT